MIKPLYDPFFIDAGAQFYFVFAGKRPKLHDSHRLQFFHLQTNPSFSLPGTTIQNCLSLRLNGQHSITIHSLFHPMGETVVGRFVLRNETGALHGLQHGIAGKCVRVKRKRVRAPVLEHGKTAFTYL